MSASEAPVGRGRCPDWLRLKGASGSTLMTHQIGEAIERVIPSTNVTAFRCPRPQWYTERQVALVGPSERLMKDYLADAE